MRAGVYGRQSRGKEKSIEEQVQLCTLDAGEQGWSVTATHRDRTSASRYRRVDREQWARVVEAVKAREFDVLVMWASSRGDRDLTSWSSLLDACRTTGTLIRVTDDDRTYDVRKGGDWQSLATQGVSNAVDSDKISTNVRRGQAGAATQGRPAHGRTPYGYVRTYDPGTGELIGQVPDPVTAAVVREIFARVARSEPISTIAADLESRDVPRPEKGRWHRQRIRDVASNSAYIGLRVYNGVEHPGNWPALVEPGVYYAARRVLAERSTTRPGAQRHLLSYLARCAVCEGPLCAVRGRYRCLERSCVTIVQDATDELVVAAVLARLASPKIYSALRRAGDDADKDALAARFEVDALTDRLNQWRRSAASGHTTPESLAVIEADLTRKTRLARARLDRATIPPALRDVLAPGEDVAKRCEALTLPAKRDVISLLIDDLRVGPAATPGSRTFDPTRLDGSRWRGDRLTWRERRNVTGSCRKPGAFRSGCTPGHSAQARKVVRERPFEGSGDPRAYTPNGSPRAASTTEPLEIPRVLVTPVTFGLTNKVAD